MAGLQFNKIGFDQKENMRLIECSEAVESVLVKLETSCTYSDNTHTGEYSKHLG